MLPTNIYPWTNFHELNLEWILGVLKEIETTMTQFVAINSLKYADPIQWDITRQYEKNTIVIDPLTGTAYISVQAVPLGVIITNTDYWSVVFDLQRFVTRANTNFTLRVEEQTTLNATFASSENDWLVWGDTLYRALVNIVAGDQYVEDSNIKRITVESVMGHPEELTTIVKTNLVAAINELVTACADLDTKIDTVSGDLSTLSTTDKTNLVAAINEVLTTITTICGDLSNLATADKTNLVAAINEVLTTITTICGDLSNLATTDKTNLVAAINEVLATITTICGDLSNLATTDKTNLVASINEVNANLDTKYKDHFRYFIDGVTGDDSNDGLTSATPFKTVEKFLEMSKPYTEIRGFIQAAGTYYVSKNTLASCSVHLTGQVNGITLHFLISGDSAFAVYASHINLNTQNGTKMTVTVTAENPGPNIYFDNCLVVLHDILFQVPIGFNGSTTSILRCEMPRINGAFSTFYVQGTNKLTNTNETENAITLAACTFIQRGGLNCEELDNPGSSNAFFDAIFSYISAAAVFPGNNPANKYGYAFYSRGNNTWVYTQSRFDTSATHAVNGNKYMNTDSYLILEKITQCKLYLCGKLTSAKESAMVTIPLSCANQRYTNATITNITQFFIQQNGQTLSNGLPGDITSQVVTFVRGIGLTVDFKNTNKWDTVDNAAVNNAPIALQIQCDINLS